VISREDVLHVARLARLQLTDDEVQRMTAELARVLDHIEMISTLDLDGVAPTSHVVEVENALREDVPTPCLPREVVLSGAPEVVDDAFAVPSPQAGGEA
jgi:aspartyl-tRNA(Asn)/glutamyl-tRNA(Gln) amidotransferase subunit C